MIDTAIEPESARDLPTATIESIETLAVSLIAEQRLVPGLTLAVVVNGRTVIDLQLGYADTQRALPVEPTSLFPMFSGSKPFGAVALWQLIEGGKLGLHDRVADYWPAFGQRGKESVLIRHILCHRGGFPTTPPSLPPSTWNDREHVNRTLEQLAPEYLPGSVSAYHFLTQHWVIAELIRLVDGRAYDDYLREEITGPLGLEGTHVVLAPELEPHCVKLHATDGTDAWGVEVIQAHHVNPIYRQIVPGASLVSTAPDMARFYAAIAQRGELSGTRILRVETVEQMRSVAVMDEIDPMFELTARRCYGFELGGAAEPRRHWPGQTSTIGTFWHGGMGSSICWGDWDTGLSFALLTNGVRRDKAGAIARRDLSDLVRTSFD